MNDPLRNTQEVKAIVDDIMIGRRSLRAFLPKAVPQEMIADLLLAAGRAPSGTNTQPWHVHVLQGQTRDKLVNEYARRLTPTSRIRRWNTTTIRKSFSSRIWRGGARWAGICTVC